ncbi:MAG: class I tRNA ligase family protein, partial [Bacteroidetes bacterium]|nr:class I tRNA ligase family protein [Bacteroidota bacterium]
WVAMDDPYITYENKYMETVWYLLKKLYSQGLLYKGYTIQPYSPKAGTGLSSHELNQPGTYRDVKDTTVVAQFAVEEHSLAQLQSHIDQGKVAQGQMFILAWTTTPWTLPSNTALCVGPDIDYVIVNTTNKYTDTACTVVLAEALVSKHLPVKKDEPFEIIGKCKGRDLVGIR